jgi:hypothetical protein
MGDVIEHMRKSAGIDLIHYFAYRAKHQVIVYPKRRRQFSVDGIREEAHNSIWDEHGFEDFDYTYESDGAMDLVILKGIE